MVFGNVCDNPGKNSKKKENSKIKNQFWQDDLVSHVQVLKCK